MQYATVPTRNGTDAMIPIFAVDIPRAFNKYVGNQLMIPHDAMLKMNNVTKHHQTSGIFINSEKPILSPASVYVISLLPISSSSSWETYLLSFGSSLT